MKYYNLRWWWVGVVALLLSCGGDSARVRPPVTFTEADLLGTWTIVGDVYSTQTVVLRADHTYTQRYSSNKQPPFTTVTGTWLMEEPHPNGCVYIHFQGMHYIYLTEYTALHGNRVPDGSEWEFHDFCEPGSYTMTDEVKLSVGSDPQEPRGLVLRFPSGSAYSVEMFMKLVVPHALPTPVDPK